VTNNGESNQYPLWYSEGFAEFLSTVTKREELLVVGGFPKARIWAFENLTWVSIKRIISATDYGSITGRDRYMLYPESWALVHYLALDREKGRSLPKDMTLYMQLISEGVAPKDAFEEAFGETTASAGLRIRRTLNAGTLRVIGIPIEKIEYDRMPPKARVPSTEEISVKLGQLALSVGNGKRAEEDFAGAIALNPNNARAQAGMGDAHKIQKRWEAAEPHFRRAVEIDGSDPLNYLDLAEFLHDSALEQQTAEAATELLAAARAAYARSRELDEAKPEGWVMDGRTYLAFGENPREGISLLKRGLEILPSSHEILESLAEAYVALGQDRKASEYLIRANATRIEGSLEAGILEQIEEIKKRREAEAKKRQKDASPSAPAR
jgi:tetratricopeptide (TPR) repeat protein